MRRDRAHRTLGVMNIRTGVRRAALAGVLGASLLAPAAASADSIVHIRAGNVWLVSPDGARSHQVTTDGTADQPYRAPSQADDGTIAASRGNNLVVLRQNGEVVTQFDPPPLVDTVSHTIDGFPVYVAISPDATKIAYSYASYSCPIGVSCAARSSSGVVDVAGGAASGPKYGQAYYGDPTWVSNSRIMLHGGYLSHMMLWDVGGTPFHWFDDQDWAGQGNSTDLGDGDLARDSRILVAVRGYDSPPDNRYRTLAWFKPSGSPATDAAPPVPEAICISGDVPGANSPTVAPVGDRFAYAKPDGLYVFNGVYTDPARCPESQDALLVAGASEPDWGPADINPQPRGGGGTQPPPTDGGGPNGNGNGSAKKCKVPKVKAKSKLATVQKSLKKANCKAKVVKQKHKTIKKGLVIKVSPKAGKTLAPKATVKVYVSRGRR